MDKAHDTTNWALLIGINFYKETPLYGCVRDVEIIKNYLKTPAESTTVKIVTLTASEPDQLDCSQPTEDPESWPTYDNVTSNIRIIMTEATPGDFVYIHYSGHGTRTEGASEYGSSHQDAGDLALVLYDDIEGSRYLLGRDLAHLLNEMVVKGLLVTLVLDCCFSGSVVRYGGAGVRTVRYNPTIDAAYPRNQGLPRDPEPGSCLRDARILPKWLIDPDRYTILSACGPHEEAKELMVADGKKYGALSFFLACALNSLRSRGTEITHQSLYQHLRVQFHVHWPNQTPMRYGNPNLSFFGKLMPSLDSVFVPVFRSKMGNSLQLGAGLAHGVCQGDEFAVYPFNSPEDSSIITNQKFITLKTDVVRALTSDLVGINPVNMVDRIKTIWKARPLTSLSSWKAPIRLIGIVPDQAQWITIMNEKRFLDLSDGKVEGQTYLFNVILNKGNEYEILDESLEKITSLPIIPSDREGVLEYLAGILEHLATFKYFEGLENRAPKMTFENSFRLNISSKVRQDHGQAGTINVKEEDELCLAFDNLSDRTLYLTIFDLGPSWQIESLLSQSGGGGVLVIPPKDERHSGREEIRWSMCVPQSFKSRGEYQCDDVLKVFVTSKSSSFSPMLLRKIAVSDGNPDKPVENPDRSVDGDDSCLSGFLSSLSMIVRGENEMIDEEWATRNFLIRTIAERDVGLPQ